MKRIFTLIICASILFGCAKKENNNNDVDRKAILINLGNIIFENYVQFSNYSDSLKISADSFKVNPNAENFSALKNYYVKTYNSFQRVQFIHIGPAEELNLIDALNFYPEDTAVMMNAINTNTYDIKTINNKAKGIQALDYLLYGFRSLDESQLLDWYSDNDNARGYLLAITGEIQFLANSVKDEWESGYLETFKARQGIDKSSSFFILTNAILENFEKYCRTAKVGIPLGYNGIFEGFTPRLNLIEGKYAQISIELMKSYVLAYESLLSGNGDQGYYSYLDQIDARFNDKLLSEVIQERLNTIKTRIDALNEPYEDEIVSNRDNVKAVFAAMQQLAITLKVDVSSAMSIDIIYQDSDGD